MLNTGLWEPSTLCRDLSSLDRISHGRLHIGIRAPGAKELMPRTVDERFGLLLQTIASIKATMSDAGITPGFVSQPRLAVAGTSDRFLQLAGEETDGLIFPRCHRFLT